MTENMIYNTVLKCFDDFIMTTGRNKDPRANGNKERKALMRFYEVISKMPRDKALVYMQLVIDNGLTQADADLVLPLSLPLPVYTPGAVVVDAG